MIIKLVSHYVILFDVFNCIFFEKKSFNISSKCILELTLECLGLSSKVIVWNKNRQMHQTLLKGILNTNLNLLPHS